jgi:hypothetical protein
MRLSSAVRASVRVSSVVAVRGSASSVSTPVAMSYFSLAFSTHEAQEYTPAVQAAVVEALAWMRCRLESVVSCVPVSVMGVGPSRTRHEPILQRPPIGRQIVRDRGGEVERSAEGEAFEIHRGASSRRRAEQFRG